MGDLTSKRERLHFEIGHLHIEISHLFQGFKYDRKQKTEIAFYLARAGNLHDLSLDVPLNPTAVARIQMTKQFNE